MLPSRHRLRAREDFTVTLRSRQGQRSGSRLVVLHAAMTDTRAGQPPRVGFVVSKAVGNAVVRNRTKRRLRAVLAERLDRLPAGMDLVVRANPPAALATSGELAEAVDGVLGKVLRRMAGPAPDPRASDAGGAR